MFAIVLLYAAAGALVTGGVYGGSALMNEADLRRRSREQLRSLESLEVLLNQQLKVSELREAARAKGIDPDLVEAGLRSVQSGNTSAASILNYIQSGQ